MEPDLCTKVAALLHHAPRCSHDMGREVCEVLKAGSAKGSHSAPLPDLHSARTGGVSAVGPHKGSAIVIGGHSRAHGRLASTEILGKDALQWAPGPEMQTPRFLSGGGALRDSAGRAHLVVAGGDDGGNYLDTSEILTAHPTTGQLSWQPGPSMDTPRRGCGSAALREGLVLVGGHDGVADVGTCELLAPGGGVWAPLPPLPHPAFCPSVAAVDGAVYCCGGYDGESTCKLAYRLDLRTPAWQRIAPMREARGGGACCSFRGRLRVFGGVRDDQQRFIASAEAFCPVAGRWLTCAPLADPLSGATAVPYREGVAVIGGSRQIEPGQPEEHLSDCVQVM